MQKMLILIGLPGSGKSTLIEEAGCTFLNDYSSDNPWGRINYDRLRWHDDGGNYKEYIYSKENEEKIKETADQRARAYALFGFNLVIDNTSLTESARNRWLRLAKELNMQVDIYVMPTPLDECIRRDALRTGWANVGRAVIERMALWSDMVTWPDKELVLVDMDGTLADLKHRYKYIESTCQNRGCFNGKISEFSRDGLKNITTVTNCQGCKGTGKIKKDWDSFFTGVSEDPVIKPTAEWIRSLKDKYYICIVSGRPIDKAGKATVEWLRKHDITYDRIFMRNSGDKRPDDIVKKEILDRILPRKIAFVIDDRPRVIRMWRENGLTCYDVGDGVEF